MSRALPTRSLFVMAMKVRLVSSAQLKCFRRHGWPRHHQAVVVARLVSPALALTKRVEPVSQVAGDLGHPADLRLQIRRFLLALLVEAPDQVLGDFPDRKTANCRWVPVFRKFLPAQEPDLAGAGVENARLREVRDAERLRSGQHLGFAIGAFIELVLLEPGQSP